MKKLVIALSAVVTFSSPAISADMAAKAPMRAAPVTYAPSWTGCYVAGGGGYGFWNQQNDASDVVNNIQLSTSTTGGGRGYFGTLGGGCDYQVPVGNWNVVFGAFGDYDWASIKGDVNVPHIAAYGHEKMSSQWSVGGRVGALVTPNLLTYFSAGYTEARWDNVTLLNSVVPFINLPTGVFIGATTYKGYFIGGGYEYGLNFLPGLFWKTEYRLSDLDSKSNPIRFVATGAASGVEVHSQRYVQTIRSELVYRFNWGGSVVAKY